MPRISARKRAYHHGDLFRALIRAALAIIETDGPKALTMRDVARRVGVSQAAPYHHFADKDALLAAVAQESFASLAAALVAGRDKGGAHGLGEAYVAFAVENRSAIRVMFGGVVDLAAHPELKKTAEAAFAVLVEAVAEGQKAGVLRRGEPRELAVLAWSMLHGLSMLWLDGVLQGPTGAPIDMKHLTKAATDTIIRGLSR